MADLLQVFSLVILVLAMVPALAHALELPGKLRLAKDAYFAVQPIYYPGFTIAGIAEPVAILSTSILLAFTPRASGDFWLTLTALVGLIGMHMVYWLFTHPVNNFWLQREPLSSLGAGFFSIGPSKEHGAQSDKMGVDWIRLRDRWEYSHVARAALAFTSFTALAIAVSGLND